METKKMLRATKIFSFDAAHFLPKHEGKCHNLHGHTYKVEVTVRGPIQTEGPACGMVMDFGDLKERVLPVIESLDHQSLNTFFENPTAENLAAFLGEDLSTVLPDLHAVKVWETPTSYVEWVR